MTDPHLRPCTAFAGTNRLGAGPLCDVALLVKHAPANTPTPILIYDDSTGRVVDVDLRGSDMAVVARMMAPLASGNPSIAITSPAAAARGRGRPKLGVIAREVTLLPRHWNWLAAQPGGASVALRKLVEAARIADRPRERIRQARDAAYGFMAAMAGDYPHFEEATRALFADDRPRLESLIDTWPKDVRDHIIRMAFGPQD